MTSEPSTFTNGNRSAPTTHVKEQLTILDGPLRLGELLPDYSMVLLFYSAMPSIDRASRFAECSMRNVKLMVWEFKGKISGFWTTYLKVAEQKIFPRSTKIHHAIQEIVLFPLTRSICCQCSSRESRTAPGNRYFHSLWLVSLLLT